MAEQSPFPFQGPLAPGEVTGRGALRQDLAERLAEHRLTALLGPRASVVWVEHDNLWTEAGRWRHDGPRVEVDDLDRIVDPNLRRYYQANKRVMADGALISASDIVNYQTEVRNISPITPAGRPRIPWPAVVVGLVLALCVAIALARG